MANSVTPLFDIGANLLDSQLSKNFNEVITRSKENNIRKIIITSSHIDDTYQAKELIDREPDLLYTTVGFHPHNAKDFKDSHIDKMLELCEHDYVKAIGECGLDYKRNYSSKNDQIINRKALAKIVFQNDIEKNWLEGIIHPFVNKRIEEELEKFKLNSIVILIIPLLFEKNYTGLCSEICYIDCSRSMQLKRLQSRDQLSLEEANQRIDAQWDNALKKQFADHIINNSNNDETWKVQLKKLYNF